MHRITHSHIHTYHTHIRTCVFSLTHTNTHKYTQMHTCTCNAPNRQTKQHKKPPMKQTNKQANTKHPHTEVKKSSQSAAQLIKDTMARIKAAIEARELQLLHQVTRHCEAKLKVLDLHNTHLQMLDRGVKKLIRCCCALLRANAENDLEQMSASQFVSKSFNHMTQAKSLVTQCSQLTQINTHSLLPGNSSTVFVPVNHIQNQSSRIVQTIEHNLGSVYAFDFDEFKQQPNWKLNECNPLSDESIRLCWSGWEDTTNSMTTQPAPSNQLDQTKQHKLQMYTVSMVRDSEIAAAVVVYQGTDCECVIKGLEMDQMYEFELSATYNHFEDEDNTSLFQVVCHDTCKVKTLMNTLKFVELSPGVVLSNDGRNATSTAASDWRYAFTGELSRSTTTFWKIKIHQRVSATNLMIGIISTNNTASRHDSYQSEASFVWYCAGVTYVAGLRTLAIDWKAGFLQGDEVLMKLDPMNNVLLLKHKRTNTVHSMSITPGLVWKVQVNFFNANDVVEIVAVTQHEQF
eukprot:c8067_g1_i2.p1 GENE.c8067_g1_i2~~c8067_g1_i2.p1  ORF type:complete len:516 (-),score=118.29 c8067_g1_i2:26-1573(-)